MSPFKSIKGRALGKLLEGYKSSDIGKGFGSGGSGSNNTATGGTKNFISGDTYHVFTHANAPESFVVEGTITNCEVLIVGGGGGCGFDVGGGGGGGGIAHFTNLDFGTGSYTVQIGSGGASPGQPGVPGTNGGNTTILVQTPAGSYATITAAGGGGGGTYSSPGNGLPGGSGGGGGSSPANPGGNATQPTLNPGISFSGFYQYGSSGGNSAPGQHGSGGGGGAAGTGGNGVTNGHVAGGSGRPYTGGDGSTYVYGSGGYGNDDGGPVRPPSLNRDGTPKNANALGSGNGANGSGTGSSYPPGDVGIVIIKY
jgi:hypothetical protein